jgi:uncharacterized protein (UPF0332 family)
MVEEKTIKEIANRIKKFLDNEIILTKQKKEHINFFLTNAKNSIETAQTIFDISTNKDFQNYTGHEDLNGFLWVINASYYSMFYTARALIENDGIKLKPEFSIHSLTFDVLVHFFYSNNKLQKQLLKDFVEAQDEAESILGNNNNKANNLIENYFWEKQKRANLTYETGEIAIKSKAETSLKRAKLFNEEIRKIVEK